MPSLYDRLRYRSYLFSAWDHVRRRGRSKQASQDTRKLVEDFEEQSIRRLRRIQDPLREHRYTFDPARGKLASEGSGEGRPLVISTLEDRIVQRSILEVIYSVEDVLERLGHGYSFGGVPEESLAEDEESDSDVRVAVPGAIEAVYRAKRRGGNYYIKSDIEGFFTNIPRDKAVEELNSLLPDDSLLSFLEEATTVEISNREELGPHLDLFPDGVLGVPQGNSLSALLGNILLYDFDRRMNSRGGTCIRYLDDFIVLAQTESICRELFEYGTGILEKLEMSAYEPDGSTSKADAGSTDTSFDYLGCQISDGFIQPTREKRQQLITEVEEILGRGKSRLMHTDYDEEAHYDLSVLSTLNEISKKLEAWSNTYSFCNGDQGMAVLDSRIDTLIQEYLGTYSSRRQRLTSGAGSRRMLGVRLLQDGKSEPILPLQDGGWEKQAASPQS